MVSDEGSFALSVAPVGRDRPPRFHPPGHARHPTGPCRRRPVAGAGRRRVQHRLPDRRRCPDAERPDREDQPVNTTDLSSMTWAGLKAHREHAARTNNLVKPTQSLLDAAEQARRHLLVTTLTETQEQYGHGGDEPEVTQHQVETALVRALNTGVVMNEFPAADLVHAAWIQPDGQE